MQGNINDRRTVKLEEVLREGYIPLFSGRPNRNLTIQKDDILNLKIALARAKSLEEFLEMT